jgi:predicted anti-sigma-YlaC factor YlaD
MMDTETHDLRCEEALDLLEPSLDGELAAMDEARLRDHLAGCRSCAAERDLAVRIQTELRTMRSPRPASNVVAFPRPVHHPMRPLRTLLAAAMLVLTIGGAVYFAQSRARSTPSPEEVARATAEARYALAYVGRVSRHTGLDLRNGILHRRMPLATAVDSDTEP